MKKAHFTLLIVAVIIVVGFSVYISMHGGKSVEYAQGPVVVSDEGSTTQSANQGISVAGQNSLASMSLALYSITPATTTVDANIVVSGKGFLLAPGPQNSNNNWLTSDHLIVWIAPQQNSLGQQTLGQRVLSAALSFASSSLPSNSQNSSTSTAAVLWEGDPNDITTVVADQNATTSINATINRFLCSQVNSIQGGGIINSNACPSLFAVAPGAYTITATIPALGLSSNPLPLFIAASSLSTMSYQNSSYSYSLHYPDDLSVRENGAYPPAPSSGLSATVFSFPKTYYPAATVTSASVNVLVTNDNCSVWPGSGAEASQNGGVGSVSPTFLLQATTTINSVPFIVHQASDINGGNVYSTTEYATQLGGQCYRLSLYSHLGNPANYTNDAGQIAGYTQANVAAMKMFVGVFNQIVQSFKFKS